jgi:hypothetical protein
MKTSFDGRARCLLPFAFFSFASANGHGVLQAAFAPLRVQAAFEA